MQRHYHFNQTGTFFTPISVIYSQLNQRAISTSPTNQKTLTFRPTSQLQLSNQSKDFDYSTNQQSPPLQPMNILQPSNQTTIGIFPSQKYLPFDQPLSLHIIPTNQQLRLQNKSIVVYLSINQPSLTQGTINNQLPVD
jgi:hypothetical protein